ncbi:MAG: penicillin-binding transpeptidase domain-containing protein [Candidatus Nomurabacteria bacterium]|nr:penicillin-binding transpeptidase domain-containing protein [Candidatus Nomurabacteria bacterium]
MIRRILKNKRTKNANSYVDPDEIFLDSQNIGNFDVQQFEGRIERPVSKKTVFFLGTFFIICGILFLSRLGFLQIQKGEAYFQRSENNTLDKKILFADRGIIFDRNKKQLAWNVKDETVGEFASRKYLENGFSHIIGYLSYPAKDKAGNYWRESFTGKDGIEKQYDARLQGVNGVKIVENDVHGKVYSENVVNAPVRGADLDLSLDSRIQTKLFSSIKTLSEQIPFKGGAGMIIDVTNGEIIASVSYPEYDSAILASGKDVAVINGYLNDKRQVFMDRTLSGLYTPGSIVKPIVALGALQEKVIDPLTKILSTGSISIPNPYDKTKETVFKDWRAQGWVNMRDAIAVSSDVYFYEIGGGFQSQKGLGIANIEKYSRMFGIGEKTGVDMPDEKSGVIPSPEWKAIHFPTDAAWRVGDTYHTAIGQYGYQVTPIQMVRAIGAVANYGNLVTPHFLLNDSLKNSQVSKIDLNRDYFNVVHEGMRQGVLAGTTVALNVPYVQVAAKSGTAQLGVAKNKVNSWVTGFFPYDHPHYAFIVMMEAGPKTNGVGGTAVMRELLDYMSTDTPEYFK